MNNSQIADQFSLLSKLMDIHGENSFKSKSYSSAAFNIERLPKEISSMDDAELFSIRGIGDTLGKKIRALQANRVIDQLEELLKITPQGIIEMLQIKGLGPKKIAVIWKELEIENIGELEYACNENRLSSLKGFGTKTQENILQSITYFKQSEGFHLWAEVNAIASSIIEQLQKAYPGNVFSITGEIRRQNETIEFIEILTDADKTKLIAQFEMLADTAVAEEDDTLVVSIPNHPKLRFCFSIPHAFCKKLFTTTGSDVFVKSFLEKYHLPENCTTENEIFAYNNIQFIPPALRETNAILDKATHNTIPRLVEYTDIKGIIHSHSKWSDGRQTIEHMAKSARDNGFEYLVISDHSQSAFYAGGLTAAQIAAQHAEIDLLNDQLKPFKIFKSIESDILSDGSLDYPAGILGTFDLVIASVHSNLKMSAEKATARVLKAVQNPFTTILGHATGRLLLSRKGYPLDHKTIIEACATHDVVIEINANPHRLDMDWRWIEYALERNVTLSIDPDAHSVAGYNDIYYGVMTAQKGGLTAANNLSSYSLARFETFLSEQNRKRY